MKIDKKSFLLENDHLYLRPLNIQDITDEYVDGLNDPEVNRFLVDVRRNVQTKELVEKYVRSNLEDPSAILLGIFVKHDQKRMVGTVRVSGIDFFHFTASIGICLFEKQLWKKGYALQAMRLVKDHLFGEFGLHYLEAGVYAKNINSINLFARAGFIEWFRIRDKCRLIDSFEEAIYFAAINPLFNTSLLKIT
jgi:[ribosomal protein S5]-alanine N-acetyltransferase